MSEAPLLSVQNLHVAYEYGDELRSAVEDVSFELMPGEVLAIVGESGAGKSVSALSMLRLLPMPPARILGGSVLLSGHGDLLALPESALRRIRGNDVGVVFQDPMTSLNPVLTIGFQIAETIRLHRPLSRGAAMAEAVALLERVEIPHAAARARQYPHEYSGGMRQRAMIAMAIANRPKLIVADEPTTALDVTVQAHVLDLLRSLQAETGAGLILITHDLGVVAEIADRVAVMYAGRIVETGTVDAVFASPAHPYTRGLIASRPRIGGGQDRLVPIPGQPAAAAAIAAGCAFRPRCTLSRGRSICGEVAPPLAPVGGGQAAACHFAGERLQELDSAEVGS